MIDYLALWMFPTLLLMLFAGYPVAFTLAGTALGFAAIGHWLDMFYITDLGFVPLKIHGIMNNLTLTAVPLFVFMGAVLERSGISRRLLSSVGVLFGRYRGSMALGVVVVGALLAASTGIVGATVVTMGLIALPTMLDSGYDRPLACGTIAAAGTLGQIIPPSIVLILLGDLLQVDVGDLFLGAIIPGLMLVLAYAAYIKLVAFTQPQRLPQTTSGALGHQQPGMWRAFIPPMILMVVVLGSILAGWASPTEAAACGAVGALVMAAAGGNLRRQELLSVCSETTKITTMVFFILVGAQFFGVVFRGLGGDDLLIEMVESAQLGPQTVLIALLVLFFILGFFLDFLEICFIMIPIVSPILEMLGIDRLWVAILFAVNLQTSFLSPPFGFALFYLKGVAPAGVTTAHIYRGVMPYLLIQIGILALLLLFPKLVTGLPRMAF